MRLEKSIYLPTFSPQENIEKTLYFDIETTGLSKKNSFVYLIGCARKLPSGQWEIQQFFAENPSQEADVLRAFADYIQDYSSIAHYNGDRFDIPFLEYRYSFHKIESPFVQKSGQDLYKLLRSLKKFPGLASLKQSSLESFLGITRTQIPNGKECISIYRDLIKYRDLSYSKPLFLHNRMDLQGLLEIHALFSYDKFLQGDVTVKNYDFQDGHYYFQLKNSLPFPVAITTEKEGWKIECSKGYDANIILQPDPLGMLKNYYGDYKNYYYLPNEDTAIHKSVGAYMDKSLRQRACPNNCYTKFKPDHNNPAWVNNYICNNLPIILLL